MTPAKRALLDALEVERFTIPPRPEPTTAERQAASEAAQKYLAENAYILPIFEEPQVFGLTAKVHGFDTESVGRPSFYSTWLAG